MPAVGQVVVGDDLLAVVLAGGYPEALARASWAHRLGWYLDCVDATLQRDVAQVEQPRPMPRLLRALAQHSGQLVNHSAVGAALGMNHVATQRYAGAFEWPFLTATLPPWHTNRLKRLAKTPKLQFLDPGLLAALRGHSPGRLRADRGPLGALLETFVFSDPSSWRAGPGSASSSPTPATRSGTRSTS